MQIGQKCARLNPITLSLEGCYPSIGDPVTIYYRGDRPGLQPLKMPFVTPQKTIDVFETGHNAYQSFPGLNAPWNTPAPAPVAAPAGWRLGALYAVALMFKEIDWCDMILPQFATGSSEGRVNIPHAG